MFICTKAHSPVLIFATQKFARSPKFLHLSHLKALVLERESLGKGVGIFLDIGLNAVSASVS